MSNFFLAHHTVSVYPKKELPFFVLFTAGLCSFNALLALLTYQFPNSMASAAKAVMQTFSVDFINVDSVDLYGFTFIFLFSLREVEVSHSCASSVIRTRYLWSQYDFQHVYVNKMTSQLTSFTHQTNRNTAHSINVVSEEGEVYNQERKV